MRDITASKDPLRIDILANIGPLHRTFASALLDMQNKFGYQKKTHMKARDAHEQGDLAGP